MRICQVELRNFRGIRQGNIVLPKHAVLLGANGAGKSTIVEALALLFGRERMVRPISDWDFFGGSPKPENRFYIIATVTEFPGNDPVAVPDWFVGENVARPVWWHDESSTLSTEIDPPTGALLATQLGLAGRYDDETCEFETVRYFYHGDADPFTDGHAPVSPRLLRDVGLFLLSSNREWDKLLSFSSSSLLKVIRENDALPGKIVEDIKHQLRNNVGKIEEAPPLSDILNTAAKELESFLLIKQSSRIAYRPTSLDTMSVLQSLVAHIIQADGSLLPVARHGAGMVSLQAFLLLLAFAEHRRTVNRNFILAAEEPELHLHPSLHQRLVHRIRSTSVQSIVTTQSPHVACGYQPHEVVFLRNTDGQMHAMQLRAEPVKKIVTNSVRNLYLVHRSTYYEALMGGIMLIPEGIYDYEWLSLLQRVAQSSPDSITDYDLRPITVVPTSDAAILETFQEVARLRPDAIPIIDGDEPGNEYLSRLYLATPTPTRIIRYGDDAGVECLAAWIIEPALGLPGDSLSRLLPDPKTRTMKNLQDALIDKKKDRELRENLVWETLDYVECCKRACEFFHDLAAIAVDGKPKNANWRTCNGQNGHPVSTALHIKRS
jgi:energy-coupling factor transporter ATP-binding protein EcfA2